VEGTPFSRPSAPPPTAPRRVELTPRQAVAKPRPRFTATHGLIVIGALAVVGLVWYGVATRSARPVPSTGPVPVAQTGRAQPRDRPNIKRSTTQSPGRPLRLNGIGARTLALGLLWSASR
jgi:hypothetical protein